MINNNIIEEIKKHFIFSNLEPKELLEISSFSSLLKLKKNKILFTDGDIVDSFFIITKGSASIFKSSKKGKEQIIHFQKSGDLLAEATIFDIKKYPASCKTNEESEFIKISKEKFLKVLKTSPSITFKLLHSYSKKLRELVSLVEDLSLNDVKKRFVKYLLNNAKKHGKIKTCTLKSSKKELASYFGTTPESLSRVITSLNRDGFIKNIDDKIFELNEENLSKI